MPFFSPLPALRRRLLAVLAVLALSLPLSAAKPVWLKLQTKEFVIYSNAREKEVVESALRYAAYRRTFDDFFVPPGGALPSTILILFRTDKELAAHLPPETKRNTRTVNFNTEVDGTPLSALAISGDADHALKLTFEFETVWGLKRLGYAVPIWMSQGTGGILSTIEVRTDRVTVGAETDGPSSPLPWRRFFEISEASKLYRDSNQLGDYLLQTRELMHWILLNDEATRPRFTDLALRLRGAPALESIEAVMNTPVAGFAKAIRDHQRRTPKRVLVFDPLIVVSSFRITPAPEAEILVTTADLLVATGKLAEANLNLDRARGLDPELPAVKDAWARRMLRDRRLPEAIQLYREAIAAGTKNPAAYLRSADARLDDARTRGRDLAGEGGMAATMAADELRRAITLNPGSAEAYQLLGRALYVSPQVTLDHIAELSRGVFLGESGQSIRLYRAGLYDRLNQTEDAVKDLRHILADPDVSPPSRRAAELQLAGLTFKRDRQQVETAVKANDHAAARAVLDAAKASAEGEAVAEDYQRLRDWVDEGEAWFQLETLSKDKRRAELRIAAREFAERFPRSRLAREARRLAQTPLGPNETAPPSAGATAKEKP